MSAEIIIGSVVLGSVIIASLGLVSFKRTLKNRSNSPRSSSMSSPRSSSRGSPRHSSEIDAEEEKEAIDYLKKHDYNLAEGKGKRRKTRKRKHK
jgi:hypothetical protein